MIQSYFYLNYEYAFILVCFCLKVLNDGEHSLLHAETGRDISLLCAYELEQDILYSIKWYRDDKEFYRFLPRGESVWALGLTESYSSYFKSLHQ